MSVRKRRGSTLALTLPMSMVFAMLGMVMMSASITSGRLSAHRHRRAAAFELAEAGFQHALKRLEVDDAYAGQGDTSFGEGSFRVQITYPTPDWDRKLILSTGRMRTVGGNWVERQVAGMVDLRSPIWDYGIIANENINLNGRTIVDSAPVTGEGNVHSNGNLTVGSNAVVAGAATAVGTVTNGGTVTGQVVSGHEVVPFPELDRAALLRKAEAKGIRTGSVTFNSGTRTLGGKIVGNLSVSSGGILIVDEVLWVTGSVSLTGRAYLGQGILVCEGPMTLSGGSGFTGQERNNLSLVCLSNANPAVSLSGTSTIRGPVYCPYGTTSLTGQIRFYGTLATNRLVMTGNAHVTRNADFEAPEELGRPQVRYWQER